MMANMEYTAWMLSEGRGPTPDGPAVNPYFTTTADSAEGAPKGTITVFRDATDKIIAVTWVPLGSEFWLSAQLKRQQMKQLPPLEAGSAGQPIASAPTTPPPPKDGRNIIQRGKHAEKQVKDLIFCLRLIREHTTEDTTRRMIDIGLRKVLPESEAPE